MTIDNKPFEKVDPATTATLHFGEQELLVDIQALRTQAREISSLLAPSRRDLLGDKAVSALEGVWNFLHAILDAAEEEGY